MKAECPQCDRKVLTYRPKDGDGTVRYFRSHVCNTTRPSTVPQWWTVRRTRAEVPGFQMREERGLGMETPR
jgi:hypothetical protein